MARKNYVKNGVLAIQNVVVYEHLKSKELYLKVIWGMISNFISCPVFCALEVET